MTLYCMVHISCWWYWHRWPHTQTNSHKIELPVTNSRYDVWIWWDIVIHKSFVSLGLLFSFFIPCFFFFCSSFISFHLIWAPIRRLKKIPTSLSDCNLMMIPIFIFRLVFDVLVSFSVCVCFVGNEGKLGFHAARSIWRRKRNKKCFHQVTIFVWWHLLLL